MSRYRKLRGFAYSIAHQFAHSAEHFAYIAIRDDVPIVSIDLLAGTISPQSFEIYRNQNVVRRSQSTLKCVINYPLPVTLKRAILLAYFGVDKSYGESIQFLGEPRFEVTLTDEFDRHWVGTYKRSHQLLGP